MSLYPVNLDIRNQLCLVIGGGDVASRKVESLLSCGAVIRVVSPEAGERIVELAHAGLLEWQQRTYVVGDLQGAKLVFAATDSREVQRQIVAEANDAGILVNVITSPDACTFQVPASFRRGDFLITVATGGGSPALAARIRKDLEAIYGPEYGLFVGLMADVRKKIVDSSDAQKEHKRIFEKLLDGDILECIRRQEWSKLTSLLENILPSTIDVSSLVKGMQNRRIEKVV
ncbi:MAG: bifunctional precorrin-2 dehydrogenase/sirohydrochlorin ferrochelatase [Desulfocapsa sp.]|nr:bifunctional precorrin-2 dehydrogenase/sirohydrochlorin ferrochelatase [Desulfocapsa sp.]